MASVFDVAKYILEKLGEMTTWKLQKLVYYSQAWSLVWDDRTLFGDDFEAWANGPVVRSLFRIHKGQLYVKADNLDSCGDSSNIDDQARETIDAVLEAYGKLSGRQLSDIAHSERPWKEARGDTPAGESCDGIIDKDVMIDFYTGLLANDEK